MQNELTNRSADLSNLGSCEVYREPENALMRELNLTRETEGLEGETITIFSTLPDVESIEFGSPNVRKFIPVLPFGKLEI